MKAVKLPKGTTINMEYTYDNSADNLRNPSTPPKRIHFGEQTTDEMAFLFCSVVAENPAELPQLKRAMFMALLKARFGGGAGKGVADAAKDEKPKDELKVQEEK